MWLLLLDSMRITSHSAAQTAWNQFQHISAINEMYVIRWFIIYLNAVQSIRLYDCHSSATVYS